DVHGAAYLDSATSQLRRLDLELSRTDRLPREFRGVRTVRAITTFMEIAPGLGIIDGVCAVNWLKLEANVVRRHPIELQQSVAYEFKKPPPDVSAFGRRDAPAWRRGQPYARSSLSCATDAD
ncbi:MAG: hypothetical protein IBJ03_17260, partial [Gemmatimonadaceae bacterium]|nr:hypothetical protein [Gemmatimonadaceae bacterium]